MDLTRVERIVWVDSCSNDGWHNPALQEYKPLRCSSYGVVVFEDAGCVSIAGSVEADDQVGCVMTIPTSAIVSRKKLK